MLASTLGHADALNTDLMTRLVHHGEHVVEPAPLLAHQIAHGTAVFTKAEGTGGRPVNAELVLDGGTGDIVTLAQRAVVIDQELRHQKERDTLIAFRGIGLTGKNEVNDVFGSVVLAPGDVDLLTADAVVIAFWNGFGTHLGKVRPARGSVRFMVPVQEPSTSLGR